MIRQMYKYTRTNLDCVFGLAENIKGLESNELTDWFVCERRSGGKTKQMTSREAKANLEFAKYLRFGSVNLQRVLTNRRLM